MTDEQLAVIRDAIDNAVIIEPDTVLELVAEVEALKSTVSYMRHVMLSSAKERYAGEA
jgi:ribosomal protein S13